MYVFSGTVSIYTRLLIKKPIITRCITAGTLLSTGDFISQKFLEKNNKKFNYKRTVQTFLMGSTYQALSSYCWYYKLMPKILSKINQKSIFNIYKNTSRFLLDTFLYTPYSIFMYLYMSDYTKNFESTLALKNV